jgi:hypothetical protein
MRRLISICGVAAVTVAILLVTIPKSYTSTAQNQGAQIVGSWYCLIDMSPFAGPGAANPGLGTFNRDGTLSYYQGNMFGGFPDNPEVVTPVSGTWANTGPGTYTMTYINLRFDRVTGVLIGIARGRGSFQFGDNFDQMRGTFFMENADCVDAFTCADPFDPQTVWTPTNPAGGLQFTGRRIRTLPVGPLP